ncbi:hypothetical protein BDF21DRAFT_431587 [Thamnidium elegans]|nr:hypothetical protein BDF21DRAFT_431587 [Thamnidium elegans]
MDIVLFFHTSIIYLARISWTVICYTTPHHNTASTMLQCHFNMMKSKYIIRSFPIVLAPIRTPNINFCFVREYHSSPIVGCPISMSFGPT